MLTGAKDTAKKLVRSIAGHIQSSPAVFARESGVPSHALFVDGAALLAGRVIVFGWMLGDLELEIIVGGEPVSARFLRFERGDVLHHFGLRNDQLEPGFVLNAPVADARADIKLRWKHPNLRGGAQALRVKRQVDASWVRRLGAGAGKLLARMEDGRWLGEVVRTLPAESKAPGWADGNIEYAGTFGSIGGMVAGWAATSPGNELWLFDESGHGERLANATRFDRADVRKAYEAKYGSGVIDAGFLLRWPRSTAVASTLKLAVVGADGVHLVHSAPWGHASHDPAGFARQAFGVPTSVQRFQDRMVRHDGILIEHLLARRQKELNELPVEAWQFGPAPAAPAASVIVPLYGRWDFVEHQLLDFSRDAEFQAGAELVYVIDDPALLHLKERAGELWKMHGVPFKLVWGHANRGYAGANNLGTRHAAGRVLVFLNSDVFPQAPGWISQLTRALDEHPDFGAVAPRLLYGDGSIQHAGMEFAWEESLGVWINKHPMMGLDPRLDTRTGLVESSAVTAACMALRRADFETVGGFDGGFLFGDFEDSDLCLKLRERGLRIGYLPEVELVHLERQSFRLLGDEGFRFKVVLYNAGRHSRKWAHFFEGLPK